MSIEDEVDRLIDERPGRRAPRLPATTTRRSRWPTASGARAAPRAAYCVGAGDAGRVIVNTGMGFEAPHHRRVFAAVHPRPTPYIVTTQAHVDHVGGVGLFREPGTQYVAQADNPALPGRRPPHPALPRLAPRMIWFGRAARDHRRLAAEDPGVPMDQDAPTPDVLSTSA